MHEIITKYVRNFIQYIFLLLRIKERSSKTIIYEIYRKYMRNMHEIFTKYLRNIYEILTKYVGIIYLSLTLK